jgi:CRP-like cAMP-binding protein
MSQPLASRLERHGPLSDEEKDVLRKVTSRVRDYGARQDIVREGDTPTESTLILEGFACRHNNLADGRRQITAFHVPGDFADLHAFLLGKMDDGVSSLTPCKVAFAPHSALREITKTYPHLTRVLWFTTLVDGAIHREWMTGLGRLSAHERMAHLLCELFLRLQAVGLTRDHSYDLPITQAELADAFGLSPVHVNRTFQDLRGQGLITSQGKTLVINDWERLQQVAQFNPDYLHADQKIERD